MKNIFFILPLLILSLTSFAQSTERCKVTDDDFNEDDEIISLEQQHACLVMYKEHKKIVQSLGISHYEGDLDTSIMPTAIKVPLFEQIDTYNYPYITQWDQVEMKRDDPSFYMPRTYTGFFFSAAPKAQFNFKRWLKNEQGIPEGILYQEPNGVIFYDKRGKLWGMRYFYDNKQKLHAFALVKVWRGHKGEKRLQEITKNYAILKTLGNPNSMGALNHIGLLKLSPQQYMKKFKYKFDVAGAKLKIMDALQELLTPKHLLEHSSRGIELGIKGSYGGSWTGYIRVWTTNQSIDQLKNQLKVQATDKDNNAPYGTFYKPIYEDKQSIIFQNSHIITDRYTYFFIEDDGLVYVFYYNPDSDYDQLRNHLDMVQLLRNISPINLNHYPKKLLDLMSNKYYSVYTLIIGNNTYLKLTQRNNNTKKQGLIDMQGNEIYPMTEHADINKVNDRVFEVTINTGDKPSKTLYDENGVILLDNYTGNVSNYANDPEVLQICEDWRKTQCQLFNTKIKQWLLPTENQ